MCLDYFGRWSGISHPFHVESASLQALKNIFPNARWSGYHFHYGQAIHRNIQKRRPTIDQYFTNNEDFKLRIKCLHSLAFMPEEYVYRYFCIFIATFPNHNEIKGYSDHNVLGKLSYNFRTYIILRLNMDRLRQHIPVTYFKYTGQLWCKCSRYLYTTTNKP